MKRTLTVYLAGPITGHDYDSATKWRDFVINELNNEFICLSPMRSKEYLADVADIAKSYDIFEGDECTLTGIGKILSSNKGINRRDSWDCRKADCILANLSDLPENKEVANIARAIELHGDSVPQDVLNAYEDLRKKWTQRVSIGTVLEIGMAWMHRKPVVCIMPKNGIHEHPMIDDMIDFRCETIKEAIQILRAIR